VVVQKVVEPPSNPLVLGLRDLKVSVGGEVRVPVVVENFNRIDTLQFTMAWDPAVVSYRGVQGFGLLGMTEANFGVLKDGQGRTNRITVSWDDNSLLGVTRTNGSVILEVVLQAVGATGTTGALIFAAEPTPASATMDTMAVPLTTVNGSVTVQSRLSGLVEYYVSTAGRVPGVRVTLGGEGTGSVTTGSDGTYSVEAPGGAFTMTPTLETDAPLANGVTTADIALIRRHVLGIAPLDSAYKVMAGDVNGSDSVTTADITLIRRLILGTATNFSTGLWRFVPSDETFSDPAKPWAASRMRRYVSLAAGTLSGQDFKAIKLGDVNGSWKAPTVAPSSTGTAKSKSGLGKTNGRLSIGKVQTMAGHPGNPGKPVSIPVTLDGVDQLGSLQLTLSWDPTTASYAGVTGVGLAKLSPEHLGLARVSEGLVSLSWDSPTGLPVDLQGAGELLRLDLVPKTGLALSGAIGVVAQPTGLELTDGQSEVAATVSPGWWVIGSESGDTPSGTESVSLRISPATGETIRLEATGPAGATLALEVSADLTTWTETQRLTGQGPGQPISFTTAASTEERTRFWRVRVR